MKLFSEATIKRFESIISEAEGRPMRIDRGELAAEVSKVNEAKEATVKIVSDDGGTEKVEKRGDGSRVSIFRNLIPAPVAVKAAYDEDDEKRKAEDEDMDDDDRKARGIASSRKDADEGEDESKRGKRKSGVKRAVSFADVIVGPASREFPIESLGQDVDGPDEGADGLGREYGNAVMDRIAGAFSRTLESEQAQIPTAGAGEMFQGDTRTTGDSGFRPMGAGEGNKGRVGGEDRGVRSGGPVMGYEDNECGPVRAGDFVVMRPANSGLMDAKDFVRPVPATSVAKKVGVFKDVVFGEKGDNADSFLG